MLGSYTTLNGLWHGACKRLLVATTDELDHWHGLTTMFYDNFLQCESMEFNVDIGRDMWMTRSRFTKLQRDYLEWEQVESFINRSQRIYTKASRRGVVTQLICRNHGQRKHDGHYQWGNCLLAFTFHGGLKHRPTFALHSRVSMAPYMGAFDLSLCWVLARMIAESCDFPVEDMRFRWYSDSLQFPAMKAIPYIHSFDCLKYLDSRKLSHEHRPTLRIARLCLHRLRSRHEQGIPLESEVYGPIKRLRTRYQDVIDHDKYKPSCPVQSLDLEPLRTWERPEPGTTKRRRKKEQLDG